MNPHGRFGVTNLVVPTKILKTAFSLKTHSIHGTGIYISEHETHKNQPVPCRVSKYTYQSHRNGMGYIIYRFHHPLFSKAWKFPVGFLWRINPPVHQLINPKSSPFIPQGLHVCYKQWLPAFRLIFKLSNPPGLFRFCPKQTCGKQRVQMTSRK